MNFAGLRPKGQGLHPLVNAMGIFEILDGLPVLAGVLDAGGAVVYRNKVAVAMLHKLLDEYGDGVVQAVRVAFAAAAKRCNAFPYVEIIGINTDKGEIKFEVSFSALTGGYLISWRDVTAEQERIRALAATADELAATSDSFEQLSARLSTDATSVASKADTVSAGAHQLSASINSISTSTSAAVNDTTTAVGAAGGASERISQLVDSSAQVEAVSRLINEIAEQTNLLALNATIEAARAGEAGKGFAVVAGEVKELAGRTSEATDRIAKTIQAIQSDSATVAASISQIVDVIGEIESKQTMIAGAVEEQSATAAEMSASVSAVAGSAQSTAEVVVELREVAGKVLTKSRELRDLV